MAVFLCYPPSCTPCSLPHLFLFYKSPDSLTLYTVSSNGTLACFLVDETSSRALLLRVPRRNISDSSNPCPPPLHQPSAQPVPIKVERMVNADQGYTPPSTLSGDRSQSQGRDDFGPGEASLGVGSVNGNEAEQVMTLVALCARQIGIRDACNRLSLGL